VCCRAGIFQKIDPPHFIEMIRRKRNLIRRSAGSKSKNSAKRRKHSKQHQIAPHGAAHTH
jgi:hypothetical protein